MRTQKKRRREGKTDYKLRTGLLKSGVPRIVVRKTNKYIIVQLVESDESQDKIITGITSRDLLKKGWDKKYQGSLKSIPAAYLTGLMLAKKIKERKDEFILDMGMAIHLPGSRIYSAAKGLIDGSLNVKVSKKVFPSEERLKGEHLKPELKKIVSKVRINLE